ncbi:MAG: hypothetical protein ACE5H0_12205, partial [Bacteroidota bacterium]
MMERSTLDKTGQTKRKIQYVAKSTYVVSLPKPWVEATFGENPDEVKANNLIITQMSDGSLTIYPEAGRTPAKSETILRMSDKLRRNADFFKKRLISKYLAGY